ncbi:group 2 major outer membrane porin protein PorA [Campylobacter jejuni]|uniref:group 2 major outer membrane porin protein PorA n=1 Tax=Campylobacter sp. BCW_6462 TaxID=1903579 RepID=UPI000874E746|nr:group 2 major outer membrane porin protein PorA [Campylobacter sp. BCW_6462]EAH4520752.1 group 2 major outer membrane porin protein PorA [Campylobacter jejuni]EAH5952506.1 group 2 major outer membrane porin protein PorA [Campylobacter jejuni]EAH7004845.1 group 2 major outer membrane porin protein PorA [Campylobacter jejuni]EAH7638663.1 group 2 major outer membrane porin protein PorA [Campylobacter jejuni]EAH8927943.1 group 2 major outer membrane porin protein PorA [Campylobacter jejuni]
MKLVKLSLVAALAASAFSAANATPLEEAIKDIDVSGVLRYRYESSNPWSNANFGSGISGKQDHKYRAQVNFSGAISDNFKAFVQFDYNSQDGGYGADSISNTSDTLSVRQLYLTYTNEDVATSVIAGKQQLNTIWTDNAIDGLVGTGIKVVNNSIDGLTLAAFAMDSFNEASDTTVTITQDGSQKITGVQFNRGNPKGDSDVSGALDWSKNIYGAAAIGSYDIAGGQFNPQLWLAYMSDNAFLYALDATYSTTIFDGINWTIEGAYLGNSVDNKLKDRLDAANGNFFALRGTVKVNGWDASLGGLYYGKKDKITVTTIEDQGNLGSLLAGEEIFYTRGSNLNGDLGRNIFGYVTGGYTFNEAVRVGADFVYGGTKTNIIGQGGKKLEAVARVDYKYSPKLNFSAFYSYVNVDTDPESTHHDAVRLQALYKF